MVRDSPLIGFLLRAGVIAALAVALGACNFRPMYGTLPGGQQVSADLKEIEIQPLTTRTGQKLRNELMFAFGTRSSDGGGRYLLRIILTEAEAEISVEEFEDVPASKLLVLTASYTLTDQKTGRAVVSGTAFSKASYDFSNQRFANIRALRDSQDRGAVVLAQDIHARIAAHFATQPAAD